MSAWDHLPEYMSPSTNPSSANPFQTVESASTICCPLKLSRNADTTRTRKLTADAAVRIFKERVSLDAKSKFAESEVLGKCYGVSPKTVRDIWDRKSWARHTESLVAKHEQVPARQEVRDDTQVQGMASDGSEQLESQGSPPPLMTCYTHFPFFDSIDEAMVGAPSPQTTASPMPGEYDSEEARQAKEELEDLRREMECSEELGFVSHDLSHWCVDPWETGID